MTRKACRKCSAVLPVSDGFYANDKTCKECRRFQSRQNRLRRLDYYQAYDRARSSSPDRVLAREEYARTARGRRAANRAKKAWTERNPVKRLANNALNNSVRDGVLSKKSICEECGKTNCRIEGHHDDYSKPLEVRWLCSACHREWHKVNGDAKNGTNKEAIDEKS